MKYILLLLTCLTLIACEEEAPIDPYAISEKTRDSIYLKVQELYTLENYKDAEKLLSSIRARDIYDLGYYSLNAKVKFNLQKYSEAVHFINSALRVNNDNASTYFLKANCYAAMDLTDTAVICLDKAIDLDSTNVRYIVARLRYHFNKSSILAIDDINRLIRMDSTNLDYQSYLALYKYQQHDTTSAIKIYEAMLQKNPSELNALKSMGFINLHRNKMSKAKFYFDKYNEFEPTNGEVFYGLFMILEKEKKNDKSCDCLLKAIELGDQEAMKHTYKCEDYFRKKGIQVNIRTDTIRKILPGDKTSEL